jgi:hypothetical protein
MITETQSYGFDVRDTFFNVVTSDSFFAGYKKRKTKMLQVQPEALPYIGVYFIDETNTPDGDANAGMIRFSNTVRIGFSVIIANNDQDAAEAQSDKAFLRIQNLLFTDLYVMNVSHKKSVPNVENVLIESIVRGTRRHVYGNPNQSNETPFVELQYEVSAFFRTEWYPDITDTLDEIHVTTGIKAGEDQAAMDQREQVEVVYDFTTSKTSKKGNGHG